MQLLSLGASLITAIQAIFDLVGGKTICLNQGCEVVEKLAFLSPLYFNILGFFYFQAVFWTLRLLKNKFVSGFDLTALLLIAGLAAEGVLLSYQIFAAQAICSYCILIFAFVVLLNFGYSRKQFITGMSVLIAITVSFSLVTFAPARVSSQFHSLKAGSYGVKSCASPTKEIYLIFSADCPHCENVIKALDNCNSCDFHLNPIDKIKAFDVDGLELNQDYSPEVNRLMLSILGVKEVPVLVVKSDAGFSFLKGENKILNYVRNACFNQQPVLNLEPGLSPAKEEITAITEDGGECSVGVDCIDQ
jgi:uncharacterized membrane protein